MEQARGQVGRRAFVRRLAGAAVAIGLGALAQRRETSIARAQPVAETPVQVRLGEVVQSGADFRAGLAEGVQLPRAGGDGWSIAAERVGGRFTSEPLPIDFACSHVGVHWRTDGGSQRGLQVELRSSRDGATWTSWRQVQAEAHGSERTSSELGAEAETFGALVGGRLGR